ncbi:MAG: Na-translocating system protein MpsC family protein [Bacillota bacterium]
MEKISKQNLRQLTQYTADFIKSKTGKGPREIKCHCHDNKIYIEMNKVLTPIELEIAITLEGITNVKQARQRFYEKYAHDYHITAGQIIGCQIIHGCSLWDIANDEAYIILTINPAEFYLG